MDNTTEGMIKVEGYPLSATEFDAFCAKFPAFANAEMAHEFECIAPHLKSDHYGTCFYILRSPDPDSIALSITFPLKC